MYKSTRVIFFLCISDLLARWLNADLYKTDFRPVPLSEKIKIGDDIYDNQFQFITKIRPMINIPSDNDHLGNIHLRRRQIFTIFDPYLPAIGIPAKCL